MESAAISSSSPAEPFQSLAGLRRSHTSLLRRQQSDNPDDAPGVEELMNFMQRAKATGQAIAASDSRDAAQTILDYWYGVLVRKDREASLSLGTLTLAEFTGSQESPDSSAEEIKARQQADLKNSAQEVDKTLSAADSAALRRLQLRLFALNDRGQAQRSQLPLSDAVFNDTDVVGLTDRLVKAGLVRKEAAGGSSEPNALVLSDDALLRGWGTLASVIKERESLREITTGWQKSGKSQAALLQRGDLLDTASDYPDLSNPEREFLRSSRQNASRLRHYQYAALGFVMLLLIGVCIALWTKNAEKSALMEDLRIKKQELETKKTELETANQKLQDQINEISKDPRISEWKNKLLEAETRLNDVTAGVKSSLDSLSPEARQAVQSHLPDDTRKILDDSAQQKPLSLNVAQALEKPQQDKILPGTSISTQADGGPRGSLSLFVKDTRRGGVYLVAPKYVLRGNEGTPVYTGTGKYQKIIGRISYQMEAAGFEDLAVARLSNPELADSSLLGIGQLTKVATPDALKTGARVALIGSGSGVTEGTIKGVAPDGKITTTRISVAGDGGAPVVLADGPQKNALVGILLSRSENGLESIVQPIGEFLKENGLELYSPPVSSSDRLLDGAMAEVFVHDSLPEAVNKAAPFVEKLQKAGFTFPVAAAQPKKVVSDPTEVRYFHEADKTIAERANKILQDAGFTAPAQVKFLPDDTAPPKFIQISVAKKAFP